MTEQYSTSYDINVSENKDKDKQIEKTIAFWSDEINSTWLLNHERDIRENECENQGQGRSRDDPGARV